MVIQTYSRKRHRKAYLLLSNLSDDRNIRLFCIRMNNALRQKSHHIDLYLNSMKTKQIHEWFYEIWCNQLYVNLTIANFLE